MSAFDVTFRVGEASVAPIEEGDKTYEAELILGIITLIPVGPDQAMPLPLGVIRTRMDKRTVGGFIQEFQKIHDQMDDRPDITIAQNLPPNLH